MKRAAALDLSGLAAETAFRLPEGIESGFRWSIGTEIHGLGVSLATAATGLNVFSP